MKLAEAIAERVPSCERVRLMNSGTEATSTAVRLARGCTGRDRIVTFHGNFHGATDALLAAGGSGVATLGLPGTAGVPAGAVAETLVVPYNQVPALDDDVAAVIVEPVAANMGVIPPAARLPRGPARRVRPRRRGADLRRGHHRVPARHRRRPGEVRRAARPHDVRQGDRRGTADRRRRRAARGDGGADPARAGVPRRHAGRQPAGHGGRARRPRPPRPRRLHRAGGARSAPRRPAARRVRGGGLRRPSSRSSARSSGWCARTARPPVDFDGARRTDEAAYAAFFQAMLAEGVAMAPGAYEAIFVGLGHDDAVLEELGERARSGGRRRCRPAELTGCRLSGRAAGTVAPMRQVLSWRFVAAIGALLGLTAIVYLAFGNNRSVAEVIDTQGPLDRRMDIVSIELGTTRDGFALQNGFTVGTMTMQVLPAGYTDAVPVTVFPGTPGEITCADLDRPCALLAQTLGDTIVWFALIPMGPNFRFDLPAIEELDGGYANLVNGWQVPYARVIDRRCDSPPDAPGAAAESFSEFLRLQGTAFHSLYDLGRGAITAVICE